MKYLLSFVVLGGILFSFTTSVSFASNPTCPGVPATLTWSSTNSATCTFASNSSDPACSFGASAGGSQSVTANSNCTVNYTCTSVNGNASAAPTLNVVNGPGCCGTGSQVGLTVWNGSTCVAAPTGSWTPSSCPSSCGYAGEWQTCTGGNGMCSGSASYCPPTGSCFACTGTAPTGGSFTSTPASTGNYPWTYAASGECTWRCNAGTSQVSNTCVAPSGTISASPTTCLMAEGASSCSTALTWNTNNPIGMSEITRPVSAHVFWGNTGTASTTSVVAAGYTFYLINNSQTLATAPVAARCVDGRYWNTSSCAPCQNGGCSGTGGSVSTPIGGLTCNNGANNPPFCDQCPANLYWDGSGCSACLNGGCTGLPGGSTTTPIGGLTCTNGRTPPSCALTPIVSLTLDGSTDLFLSNYPANNATIAWNGNLGPAPTSCAIPSGNWSNIAATAAPYTGSGNTDPLPAGVTNFSYECTNAAGATLVTARATVCQLATPVLTTAGGACQGLPVAGLSFVSGNYTPSATIRLSCSNSAVYRLKRDGTTVSSGAAVGAPFILNQNITIQGDYTLECDYTSIDGHTFTAISAATLKYKTAPTDPVVSITATPISISKSSASVISWVVMFPNSIQSPVRVPGCQLRATPVCTGTCTADQLTASTTVNTLLSTGETDSNDPAGKRLISSAVNEVAFPGPGSWKAQGKKTIVLEKSMNFKLDCGGSGTQSSSTVRVIVTSTNEG